MEQDAETLNYFIQNVMRYKQLLKPIKEQTTQAVYPHPELEQSMLETCRWVLACDMCVNLHLSVDKVMDFLDNINIKELIQ